MDTQQMQQEMQRIQLEIMQIQAKYTADPTPENMMKMQQEMATLTQQMTDLSMQYASAAMNDTYGDQADAMMAAAMVGQNGGNFDVSNLFTDGDDEEEQEFVKQHPVPPDKEKYLPIGALLLSTGGEPYETFAIMQDDWLEAMEDGWGMSSADEGKEMLSSLLEERHEAAYGDDYRKLKAGQANGFDEESIEGYEETLQNVKEDVPALLPSVQKCDTLLAWDLERAGYLARIFVSLNWLNESEMFDWLEKTAEKIKAAFSSWEEYVASIMMGRAVAMGFDFSVVGAAYELFGEKKAFFKNHPISGL
jgi:hypothetical protein